MSEKFEVMYDAFIRETDLAWILKFENREVALPKSQCEFDEEEGIVMVPQWLIEAEELDEYIQ